MTAPTIIVMGRRLRPLEPVTVIGDLLLTWTRRRVPCSF